MNVIELMQSRHSSRAPFDPERRIPAEHMMQIIEAARWAPTAHNMQNFEIVVVDDRSVLEAISKIESAVSPIFVEENYAQLAFSEEELREKKVGLLAASFPPSWRKPGVKRHLDEEHAHSILGKPIANSAALLIVLYDPRRRAPASEGDVLGMMSLGCVMQNVWLAAESLGIGLQVQSVFGDGHVESRVKELLHVPAPLRIAFAVRLGYPTKPDGYLRVRRDVRDFVHANRFGARRR